MARYTSVQVRRANAHHRKVTFDDMDRAWKVEDLHIEASNARYARAAALDDRGAVLVQQMRLAGVTP